jgi:hypothetical protein
MASMGETADRKSGRVQKWRESGTLSVRNAANAERRNAWMPFDTLRVPLGAARWGDGGLSHERYGSRSTERAGELGEDRQVGVQPNPPDSQR